MLCLLKSRNDVLVYKLWLMLEIGLHQRKSYSITTHAKMVGKLEVNCHKTMLYVMPL